MNTLQKLLAEFESSHYSRTKAHELLLEHARELEAPQQPLSDAFNRIKAETLQNHETIMRGLQRTYEKTQACVETELEKSLLKSLEGYMVMLQGYHQEHLWMIDQLDALIKLDQKTDCSQSWKPASEPPSEESIYLTITREDDGFNFHRIRAWSSDWSESPVWGGPGCEEVLYWMPLPSAPKEMDWK